MAEYLNLIAIGIALSLDAFSLSLSIGTLNLGKQKSLIISILVGIFHFFMPILGLLLGTKIMQIFHISGNLLVSVILFYIAFEMIRGIIDKEEISWNMSLLGMISFAFGVSIDSFSIGLGLIIITEHILTAVFIFSFCSLLFTYLGLLVGKYAKKKLGTTANIIGIILLIILGIIHLF